MGPKARKTGAQVQPQVVEHLEVEVNPEDVVNAGLEGEAMRAQTRAAEEGARANLLQRELERVRRENAYILAARSRSRGTDRSWSKRTARLYKPPA